MPLKTDRWRSSNSRLVGIYAIFFRGLGGLTGVLYVEISGYLGTVAERTLIPGLIGCQLLRRRPLQRVERLQRSTASIVSGNLRERLPLSPRRDELDMLAHAVSTMLEHIEQLMHEVKSVCDGIAHDLRTPLTRLRARLYQLQLLPMAEAHALGLSLSLAIEESEAIINSFFIAKTLTKDSLNLYSCWGSDNDASQAATQKRKYPTTKII